MFAYSAESRLERACAGRCGRYWKRRPAPKLRLAADEAGELRVQVVAQQARVAGDRRVGRVHQRVPVDLVEADGRPAPEARARRRGGCGRRSRRGLLREPERAAGLPRVDKAVDDLGVEDEVLAGVGAPHRARPPGACVCEPAAGWAAGCSMKTGGDTSARAISARGGRCARGRCGPAARRRCG